MIQHRRAPSSTNRAVRAWGRIALMLTGAISVTVWCLLAMTPMTEEDVGMEQDSFPSMPTSSPWPSFANPNTDSKYRIYTERAFEQPDASLRCQTVGICDGDHSCGPDGLGCVLDPGKRRDIIREAARWTWLGYKKYAWGHDEVDAQNKKPRSWFNVGLTIVDSVDTLLIMGLDEEYQEARQWVANHLDFSQRTVSVFESTIRILGGMLSAFYHSGGDELFLRKAVEFAERMLPAFHTTSGVAVAHFTIPNTPGTQQQTPAGKPTQGRGARHGLGRTVTASTSAALVNQTLFPATTPPPSTLDVGVTNFAEAGTLSMEFSSVTHITGAHCRPVDREGRPEFQEASMLFWYALLQLKDGDGLYCTNFQGDSLSCSGNHYTMGAAADSAYEYMLKQWILSAGKDQLCLDFYHKAMRGLRKHMLTRVTEVGTEEPNWVVAEVNADLSMPKRLAPDGLRVINKNMVVEHLTCFVPGMLALGHMYGQRTSSAQPAGGPTADAQYPAGEEDDLMLAVRLVRPCYELYSRAPSGVAYDAAAYVPWFPPPPPRPPSPPQPPSPPPSPPRPPRPPSPPPHPPPFPPLPPGGHAYIYILGRGHVDPTNNRLVDPQTGQYLPEPPTPPSQLITSLTGALGAQPLPIPGQSGIGKAAAGSSLTQEQLYATQTLAALPQPLAVGQAVQGLQRTRRLSHMQQWQHAEQREELADPGQLLQQQPDEQAQQQQNEVPGRVEAQSTPAQAVKAARTARRMQHLDAWSVPYCAASLKSTSSGPAASSPEQRPSSPSMPGCVGIPGQQGVPSDGGPAPTQAAPTGPGLAWQTAAAHWEGFLAHLHWALQHRGQQARRVLGRYQGRVHQWLQWQPHILITPSVTPEDGVAREGGTSAADSQSRGLWLKLRRMLGSDPDAGAGSPPALNSTGPSPVQAAVRATMLSALHTSDTVVTSPPPPPNMPPPILPPPHPPAAPPFPPPPPVDYESLAYSYQPRSNTNWLRPEVVESLFYLYRATGDPVYREWGWNMFRAYEAFCKLPSGGYTVMERVDTVPPVPGDKMESFWLAETLKYFYLLFSEPDVIPLDQFVFNTEAHPLPRWGSPADTRILDLLQQAQRSRAGQGKGRGQGQRQGQGQGQQQGQGQGEWQGQSQGQPSHPTRRGQRSRFSRKGQAGW
ncbi:hypothetical protein QJQ45_018696 [Haematococcus lacustris]|nr:hypothetical protein QJQ45_018696 [Haematococcus lacustris]